MGYKTDGAVRVPEGARSVLHRLLAAGYDAYVVGGCVRDSLLGREPHDWDVCTSATPEEMKRVFSDAVVCDAGVRHGTLTVRASEGELYEVTTFRTDGAYSDNRHPDSVSFVSDLREDLARRDFTVNAMAYRDGVGVIDLFGGRDDLAAGLIRCVGDPDTRFGEDALRVLRALRFASAHGFSVEPETAAAVHRNAPRLRGIAAERVREELCGLLRGGGVLGVLLEFSDVIAEIMPELAPCIGFEQHSRYHLYTVYEHTARAVAAYSGDDLCVRLALLLHDVGKPRCFTRDESGGHFRGHAAASRELAKAALERLRFDSRTKDAVLTLVEHHDADIPPQPAAIRRWLGRIGEEQFRRLLDVRLCDALAQSELGSAGAAERRDAVGRVLEQVLEEKQCFRLSDLAISGADALALGVPEGKAVGALLHETLDAVISGGLANDRETLLAFAARRTAKYREG